MVESDKLSVQTENVAQLVIDLDRASIDWTHRTAISIDGFVSELTRRSYPTLHLRRLPSGGWETVPK